MGGFRVVVVALSEIYLRLNNNNSIFSSLYKLFRIYLNMKISTSMITATMLSSTAAFSFSRNGAKFGARVSTGYIFMKIFLGYAAC